jgi:hypothetical protein
MSIYNGLMATGISKLKDWTDHLIQGRGPHDAHHSPTPYRWWALQVFLTVDTWAYSLCSIIPQFWRSTYRFLISSCCISALWRHSKTISNPSAHHTIQMTANSKPDTELCIGRNISVRIATVVLGSNLSPVAHPTSCTTGIGSCQC